MGKKGVTAEGIINVVGSLETIAAPIAVDVEPSIPLVPLLQNIFMLGLTSKSCAYLIGELLPNCNCAWFGRRLSKVSNTFRSENWILAK